MLDDGSVELVCGGEMPERTDMQIRIKPDTQRKLSVLAALLRYTYDETLVYLLNLNSPELDRVRKILAEMDETDKPALRG